MALKRILVHPHKALRKAALKVRRIDDAVLQLGRDLQETMRTADGIGLAAPQIGVARRVLVVRTLGEDDNPENDIIAVNPEIDSSEGEVQSDEGCLSVPGVRGTVQRAEKIRIAIVGLDGKWMEVELGDHRAVVFQHEIDHLDGILFFDHMSRLKRNALLRHYRRLTADGA